MHTQTLVTHSDIQKWVEARRGQPAIRQLIDSLGQQHASLDLSFGHEQAPHEAPTVDQGISPCSWAAWLAELDRQNLALRVEDSKAPSFEFVSRNGRPNQARPSVQPASDSSA